MSRLEVSFINETTERINKNDLTSCLKLILRRLNHPDTVSIELIIVGDRKIAELNRQFRDTDKATDVLSFSETKSPHSNLLGSLVVSVDTARKQATEAGVSLTEELKVLTGHGFLHLLGFHHN